MEEWIKENYEKASLGGAAVIAIAVGAMILFGGDGSSKKKDKVSTPDNSTEIASFARLSTTLAERKSNISIAGGDVDVFIGKDLYARRGSTDPVDLEVSDPVHKGIPNKIWIELGLDPSFENSPELDPDGDGFSIREEIKAGTDPTKAGSHPEPVVKLLVGKVNAFEYRIRWSEFAKPQITLRYEDVNGGRTAEQAKPGDLLFEKGPMKGRFKLGERKKMADPNGKEQDAYTLIDQSDFMKDDELILFRRGLVGGANAFNDYSATLELNALGQQGKAFTIKQGESFSLPYDANATKKPYRLKSIKPNGQGSFQLLIENSGGDKTPHNINHTNTAS